MESNVEFVVLVQGPPILIAQRYNDLQISDHEYSAYTVAKSLRCNALIRKFLRNLESYNRKK